jgi:hypothetical protein
MSRTRRYLLTGGAALAALVVAWPVMAHPLYNTERVLPHRDNECTGVPACQPAESSPLVVDVDQTQALAVNCPDSHAFVWHWDTEQQEHMHVRLVGRTRSGLTFSVRNEADVPGQCQIFVGCSSVPFTFARSGFKRSRSGLPSKNLMFKGGSPE